ncbi:MAG: hypothetical protein PWQ41_99 [Bacillota bacterium]|jgi:dinuclear metal center YbgI/SA1388 family protein|nr:hypothetical protein [Bacillota bacterium]MDK2924325.1 hypothetical protein [Bacillota bacterium]
MPVSAARVASIIEELAPRNLAEEWDNPGWQLGDPACRVNRVLVSLDPGPDALQKAKELKAELLVTHHPLYFRPLKHLRLDLPEEALAAAFLQTGIAVYSAHTNLDVAPGGTSDILARRLGLNEVEVLAPREAEKLYKIVTFVPPEHVDAVHQALAAAGAGWIGNYSHCSFQIEGTGTFLPGAGTDPYIGRPGVLERVREIRLETVVPAPRLGEAISRMLKAHPYEEVAYDVYPLAREGRVFGLGRVGELKEALPLGQFAQLVKEALGLPTVWYAGEEERPVQKVAVCGGSGSSLIGRARAVGADVLVTGDVKYHELQSAALGGLAVIDAGHAGTENPVVTALAEYITEKLAGEEVEVIAYVAPPDRRYI